FIEEAYPLTRTGGTNADFGQEAIDTLVEPVEDHRAEVAVIVPGYTAEMRQFLDNNLGLTSRFARTLEFENYTPSTCRHQQAHRRRGGLPAGRGCRRRATR